MMIMHDDNGDDNDNGNDNDSNNHNFISLELLTIIYDF